MASEVYEREGWRLVCPADADSFSRDLRDKLIGAGIAAAAGTGGLPNRRSRHAATYQVRALGEQGRAALNAFVKIYDGPSGLGALKRFLRGSRAAHAARVSAALRAMGFGVPRLILWGEESASGRTMLATECAEGTSLAGYLGERTEVERKGEVLHALGAEIARLHRAGYIHGDLTPYNVFLASLLPPRFVFIDHDRTRRAFLFGRRRRQLRNLVQLLRFDLPRLTSADRMQIFRAWAEGLDLRRPKPVMRRGFDMLELRVARDRRKARRPAASQQAAVTGEAVTPNGAAAAQRAGGAG